LSDYQFSMQIYSRQGQLVFETNDANIKWDGKIQGTNKMCDRGVYTYLVVAKDKYGNVDKRKGPVTLMLNE